VDAWAGSIFVVCANCRRATADPSREQWRFYPDDDDVIRGFCPPCWATQFPLVRSRRMPAISCPECDGQLHPQPQGGWVCEDHGMIFVPNLTT